MLNRSKFKAQYTLLASEVEMRYFEKLSPLLSAHICTDPQLAATRVLRSSSDRLAMKFEKLDAGLGKKNIAQQGHPLEL